jgi:hypothetical protein
MAVRKPEDVLGLVKAHERATLDLRDRWDSDWKLYLMERTEDDAPEDYQFYTSNDAKTYAKKLMGWQNQAKFILQITKHDEERHERNMDDQKETWIREAYRLADERLTDLVLPVLRSQMSAHSSLRGWDAGRVLLRKRQDGSTYVDITPWDPMNTFWGMGADGLAWAVYSVDKPVSQVEAEYRKNLGFNDDHKSDLITIYDYYDHEMNLVVTDDIVLKKATPHGDADGIPVYLSAYGGIPPMMSRDVTDTSKDYGESIFEDIRLVVQKQNQVLSILMEHMYRTRKPGVKIFSRDGSKTLEEDPHKEGSFISLRGGEEDIAVLDPIEAAKETGALLGIISGERQRGSLSNPVFGEVQFALSGFAINTLKQGMETALGPRLAMMENTYRQINNILIRQYASGSFKPFETLPDVSPDMVKEGCKPVITLAAVLPEDDVAKMAIAQQARDGPFPLLPDYYIHNNILKLPDADNIEDSIKAQMAQRMLPEAQMWELYKAATTKGQQDIAQFYIDQLMTLYMQKIMALRQTGMPPQSIINTPAPPVDNESQNPNAFNPTVLPQAFFGPPQQAGAAQSVPGPAVPPGTPRPGAMSPEQRLNRIGLELGRR